MKLFFFGNCILNSFKWNLREECFDGVFCIESFNANGEEVKDFISQVGHSDALVMQPHSSRLSKFHHYSWIISQLPNTKVVSLPSPFLNIYNPLEFNPKSLININQGFHLADAIIYLDPLMALFIIDSKSIDISSSDYIDFIDRFPSGFWDILASSSLNSFKKLENLEKERNCTVLLSQVVKESYKKFQVMKTINHPSNELCNFMIQAIANQLDLSQDSWRERYDYFPEYRSTIYTQMHSRLNLQFAMTTHEDIDEKFNILKCFLAELPEQLLNNLREEIFEHLNSIGVSSFVKAHEFY